MPNEYVNKVEFGNETVMDITDTTAETGDVLEGEVFYAKSGARSVGTLGDATQSAHGLMSAEDKTKLDSLSSYSVMTGATSSTAGASGLVPAPTTSDVDKFLAGDGTYKEGGQPMVILSYGNSTWNDFINAYNNNVIVYCRASSNSNPASGSQTRMAFMAYVNNATTPTEVEFQYYRSVSSHTASQQGDQVFVYKLTSSGTWTVTTREAMAKIVAGTNMSSTYSNNVLTINGNYSTMTGASSSTAGITGLVPAPSIGDNNKFLKGDGTWDNVPNPQVMTGASSSAAGVTGLVPAPSAGDEDKYLRGDGTWNSVDISGKADKADTVLTTTLSRGRKSGMSVGTRSFAFGDNVTASGTDSFAQGSNTTASEEQAHAEGRYTTANGYYSHAEGNYTTASGMASHAEGTVTTATHANQHVFGEYNVADSSSASAISRGNYIEIVGNGTGSDAKSNARALDWNGNEYLKGDLYVGCGADSSGGTKVDISAKADKEDTVLTSTLSRGRKASTTAGTGSFAFGNDVTASGIYAHAEGFNTSATGSYSHAEGGGTTARVYSHAEGYMTKATGDCSHSEGQYTTSQRKSQHVSGEYNVPDTTGNTGTRGDYVEIIGNGTSTASLSNARALDWNGNERLAGDLYVNCNADSTGGTKVVTSPMTGATSSTAGISGLVPAPASGDQGKYLRGDGTWAEAGGIVYGNTIDMSSTDSTKVATAIGNKLNANQGSANAGKFMRVGSTGAVEYDYPTERYASLNDFPATGDEGKLYIAEDNGMIYVWDDEYVPVGGFSEEDCEASGSIVSFDAFESPVKELVIDIDPVQDLHGYDSPWPAGGGKNLIPYPYSSVSGTYNEVTFTKYDDGTVNCSGTASGTAYFNLRNTIEKFLLKAGTYIVNGHISGSIVVVGKAADNTVVGSTSINNGQFTVSEDTEVFAFIQVNSGNSVNGIVKPMIRLSSVSDDTFAPYSNICPISGWDSANVSRTGKNLLSNSVSSASTMGVTFTVNPDRSVTIATDGTATGRANLFYSGELHLPPSDYYLSTGKTFATGQCYFELQIYRAATKTNVYGNTNGTSGFAFTLNEGDYIKQLYFSVFSGKTVNDTIYPQIEVGSTATTYKPYSGSTTEYEFPQEAGTVYGGSLTIHQDGTGELVVHRAGIVLDGSQDISSVNWRATATSVGWIYPYSLTNNKIYTTNANVPNIISSYLPKCSYQQAYGGVVDNGITTLYSVGTASLGIVVRTSNTSLTTKEAINSYLASNPLSVVYELATPVTYQLTNQQVLSLLKGQNNVWADCGAIDLTYYRTETAYQVSLNTADIAELQGEVEANSDAIEELQNDFTGATASADGAHGLVPAPDEGDQGKFLRGDATWANPATMTGATASSAGSSGFVPVPSAGDQNKVLTGAGTWWLAGAPLLTPSTAFSIPSVGTPAVYDMPGITENYELIQWNFSASAENNPPASLSWETYDGYFMITNNAGTTSETIKPVFAQMVSATITQHIEEGE